MNGMAIIYYIIIVWYMINIAISTRRYEYYGDFINSTRISDVCFHINQRMLYRLYNIVSTRIFHKSNDFNRLYSY